MGVVSVRYIGMRDVVRDFTECKLTDDASYVGASLDETFEARR